jgi:hypothetical protein
MADNVQLNQMADGVIVATDEIDGKHHQKVKLEYGADDQAVQVTSSNPLPVSFGSLVAGKDFDYLVVVSSSATQDTLTYKLGGSSGSVVQTLIVEYVVGADKISDSVNSLAWS